MKASVHIVNHVTKRFSMEEHVMYHSQSQTRVVGAHAHVRDASCFQEPILAFFSAFGLSHWTVYYLSFFSMLTLSNFSVCPNFLLFI